MRSEEEKWRRRSEDSYAFRRSVLLVWIVADETDTCIEAAVAASKQSSDIR
jgi:hypothetical protein